MRRYIRIIIPIALGASGFLSMWLIAHSLQHKLIPMWTIAQHEVVNFTITMQLMVLPVSFLLLAVMYLLDRDAYKKFFRIGISSGTDSADSRTGWKVIGPLMAVFFSLGLTLLMSVSVVSQQGTINTLFFKLLPLVIFSAAANAWNEEIFSRFIIVAGLHDKLRPITICWISAILFGLPHFWGTPSGVFGVLMSGLLGWFLAKSVIDTKGLGWALWIHFILDVVIFGAGAMIIAGA